MAYENNTSQAYIHDQTSLAEEVHDSIVRVDPVTSPLLSLLPHERRYNYIAERQVRDIGWAGTNTAMNAATAHPGQDATFSAARFNTRMKAMAAIFADAYDVDNTSQASAAAGGIYGITNALLDQQTDVMFRLLKNCEQMLHWGVINTADVPTAGTTVQTSSGSPDGDPRKTDGLMTWLARFGVYTNYPTAPTVTGAGTDDHPLTFTLTDAHFSTFYEANNTDLDERMFLDNIVDPASRKGFQAEGSLIMGSARVKRLFNKFALGIDALQRNINAADYTLIDTIHYIDTPYGVQAINRDRYFELPTTQTITLTGYGIPASGSTPSGDFTFTTNDSMAVINPEFWSIGVHRGFGVQTLATIGDSVKEQLVGELMLECHNPALAGCGATGILAP